MWCSSLRLWLFLRRVCLDLLLWFSGCLFSDSFESPVPFATWSPFGTSRDSFGLCFLGSGCLPFRFVSIRSSALFASDILLVSCSPVGFSCFFLVLGLLRCWFFPRMFLVPTRSGSFCPSFSVCLLRSPVPFASGPPVRPSSLFFPVFLVFFSLSVSWVSCSSFVFAWIGSGLSVASGCFTLSAFFSGGTHIFFLLGPPSGSFSSPPSGSSLGFLCHTFGLWPMCPLWVSLASSCRVAVLQAVSLAGFLLCLFLFLCSLQWPGLRRGFASVSCLSSSGHSRWSLLLSSLLGCSISCLPFWHV